VIEPVLFSILQRATGGVAAVFGKLLDIVVAASFFVLQLLLRRFAAERTGLPFGPSSTSSSMSTRTSYIKAIYCALFFPLP
jgi:succinate dehydrogenase/fumarate reductase cytochrome b subunit